MALYFLVLQAQYVFVHKAMQNVIETETSYKGNGYGSTSFSGTGYSSVMANRKRHCINSLL